MHKFIFLTALITLLAAASQAQTVAQRQQHFNLEKQNLALEGYDPVSYFTGKPLKGNTAFSQTHEGISYRFSSATNRELFKANPKKYEPAYGGWCAYAMAKSGEKVDVDPLTFKILNGRLLLFYNRFFTNTLELWNEQKTAENERLAKGDEFWKGIISK